MVFKIFELNVGDKLVKVAYDLKKCICILCFFCIDIHNMTLKFIGITIMYRLLQCKSVAYLQKRKSL